jgi:hypothetical protein
VTIEDITDPVLEDAVEPSSPKDTVEVIPPAASDTNPNPETEPSADDQNAGVTEVKEEVPAAAMAEESVSPSVQVSRPSATYHPIGILAHGFFSI